MKKSLSITRSKNKKSNESIESIKEAPSINMDVSEAEIFLGGLHILGAILAPIDEVINQFKKEFNKFMDDPFDVGKKVSISEQRLLYEEFGNNTLHAWKAIQIWHESSLQVSPQWAFGVIAKSAKEMSDLGTVDRKIDTNIKSALKIDGNKVKKFKKNMFWLEVFHDVDALIDGGLTQTNAYMQVAEKYHGKAGTWRNVEKRYLDFRAKLDGVAFAHPFDP